MDNERKRVNYFDFIGKSFNKFTVLKAFRDEKTKRIFFEVKCD